MNDVYIINVQTMVCLCVVGMFKCTHYNVIVVVMIHVCCELECMKCVSSIMFQHTGDVGWFKMVLQNKYYVELCVGTVG